MLKSRLLVCCCLMGASFSAWSADLLELYNETVASDPRLQRAESEAAVYQAREKAAFGGLLPNAQLGAQGTRTVQDSSDTKGADVREYYNGERYFFSVIQPLYSKTAWDTWRGARATEKQYESRLHEMSGVIAVDLADRYTKLLAEEDNRDFVTAERKTAEEQMRLIRARYDRQLAKITDLLAVEARVDTLLAQELQSVNDVSLAREAIAELVGRSVDEKVAGLSEQVSADIEIGQIEDWITKGVATNAGLEATRQAVRAAVSDVKAAQGQHHPELTLNLNAQKSDIGYENSLQPTTETYVAALNLTIPLFSGGQASARVSEAQAKLRMAENNYQEAERALRKNIRQAWLNSRSAQERIAATSKALASAEKSYLAQQRGLEYGTVTVADVLDALETRFQALRDNRQAYYDLMVQSLSLYQAAGQFSPDNITAFNRWLVAAGETP